MSLTKDFYVSSSRIGMLLMQLSQFFVYGGRLRLIVFEQKSYWGLSPSLVGASDQVTLIFPSI